MSRFGLHCVQVDQNACLFNDEDDERLGYIWHRNFIRNDNTVLYKTVKELNSYGVYYDSVDKVLKFNGRAIGAPNVPAGSAVSGDGEQLSVGRYGMSVQDSKDCVNITLEDYNALRAGGIVKGYMKYSDKTVYNIVDDVAAAPVVQYDNVDNLDDPIYNSIAGISGYNTVSEQTFRSTETPELNVRRCSKYVKDGGTLDIEYFVDDKYCSSIRNGNLRVIDGQAETFTVVVRCGAQKQETDYRELVDVIYRKTTFAGAFYLHIPVDFVTLEEGEDYIKTWVSVQVIDSSGRGSAEVFYDVMIMSCGFYNAVHTDNYDGVNMYEMTEGDLETYGIVPVDFSAYDTYDAAIEHYREANAEVHNNALGFERLFAEKKEAGYDGVIIYNANTGSESFGDDENTEYFFDVRDDWEGESGPPKVTGYYLVYYKPNPDNLGGKLGLLNMKGGFVPILDGAEPKDPTNYAVSDFDSYRINGNLASKTLYRLDGDGLKSNPAIYKVNYSEPRGTDLASILEWLKHDGARIFRCAASGDTYTADYSCSERNPVSVRWKPGTNEVYIGSGNNVRQLRCWSLTRILLDLEAVPDIAATYEPGGSEYNRVMNLSSSAYTNYVNQYKRFLTDDYIVERTGGAMQKVDTSDRAAVIERVKQTIVNPLYKHFETYGSDTGLHGEGYYYLNYIPGATVGDAKINVSVPLAKPRTLPDDFIIDFNNTTFRSVSIEDAMHNTSVMFSFVGASNLHFKNGRLVHDYTEEHAKNTMLKQCVIAPTVNDVGGLLESHKVINFTGARFCSFNSMEVSNTAGYEFSTRSLGSLGSNAVEMVYGEYEKNGNMVIGAQTWVPGIPATQLGANKEGIYSANGLGVNKIHLDSIGYISPDTGSFSSETVLVNRDPLSSEVPSPATGACLISSSDFVDISQISGQYTLYYRYEGTAPFSSRKYKTSTMTPENSPLHINYRYPYSLGKFHEYFISCYDEDHNFIRTIKTDLVYEVFVPEGTRYVKFTFYGLCSSDGDSVLMGGSYAESFSNFRMDIMSYSAGCVLNNIYIHDTRTAAITGPAFGLLIQDCRFDRIANTFNKLQLSPSIYYNEEAGTFGYGLAFVNCHNVLHADEPSDMLQSTSAKSSNLGRHYYRGCTGIGFTGVPRSLTMIDCVTGTTQIEFIYNKCGNSTTYLKRCIFSGRDMHATDGVALSLWSSRSAAQNNCDEPQHKCAYFDDVYIKRIGIAVNTSNTTGPESLSFDEGSTASNAAAVSVRGTVRALGSRNALNNDYVFENGRLIVNRGVLSQNKIASLDEPVAQHEEITINE